MTARALGHPIVQVLVRWLPLVIAAGLLLIGAQRSLAQTRVVVQSSASIAERGGPKAITLADIARLDGPDAGALGKIVVVTEPRPALDGTVSVPLAMVRAAMDAAGTHWGRVTLSGGACVVRVASIEPEPTRERSPLPNAQPKNPPQLVDVSGPATMRTVVALRLAELYGVDVQQLRIAFDPGAEEFLNTPYVGERIDIQPAANASSARVPLRVTTYSGDRVVLDRTVSTQSLVLRRVVTSTETIERNQAVRPETLVEGEQWLAPGIRPAPAEQARVSVATRRVAPGQVITLEDITPPLVVKRGDTVWVHALSGAVTVKAKAKALGAGRDGEVVSLKLDGTDRVVSARMSGAGRAVMVVGLGGE
jgi:flagella basal body P-ring formation protein FlgA